MSAVFALIWFFSSGNVCRVDDTDVRSVALGLNRAGVRRHSVDTQGDRGTQSRHDETPPHRTIMISTGVRTKHRTCPRTVNST